MTIKELVEKLNELDPELHVFIPGYEGGYHFADISKSDSFCLNVNTAWYYGPHETLAYINEEERPNYKIVKGIVL